MTREQQIVKLVDDYKASDPVANQLLNRNAAFGLVRHVLEWADSHPAWVSVEEKMPEENTAPLVRMDLTEKFGEETILYDVVAFDGNGFHTPYRVTHWKQIVPPVKKGGEE